MKQCIRYKRVEVKRFEVSSVCLTSNGAVYIPHHAELFAGGHEDKVGKVSLCYQRLEF